MKSSALKSSPSFEESAARRAHSRLESRADLDTVVRPGGLSTKLRSHVGGIQYHRISALIARA
jgi:hypothetical protein